MRIAFLHPIAYDDLIDRVHIDPIKIAQLFRHQGLHFFGETFEITKGAWPQDIGSYDAYIISGSPNSAYEDEAWILRLEDVVREIYAAKKKLLGICFGHQIIAKALGGEVQDAGQWLLGTHQLDIVRQAPWMAAAPERASLYFINHDQVTRLPAGAEVLAKNAACPRAMFAIGHEVLCLQAHPEQHQAFLETVIEDLDGHLAKEDLLEARASLSHPPDQRLFIQWLIDFLTYS